MNDIFSSLTIHAVLAPAGRRSLIPGSIRDGFKSAITEIVDSKNQTLLACACLPDHVHLLLQVDTETILTRFLQQVKSASAVWMNREAGLTAGFMWQRGFGVFTYSTAQRRTLADYFSRQEDYHRTRSFREEYTLLLHRMGIPYEMHQLFDFYEDVRTWSDEKRRQPHLNSMAGHGALPGSCAIPALRVLSR